MFSKPPRVSPTVPRHIADIVDERDDRKCVRCRRFIDNNGSRHHRQRRQVGGHRAANILLLCGSGTTGCHGWVHGHASEAYALGLLVHTWVGDVGNVPVRLQLEHGFYGRAEEQWVQLDDDGNQWRLPDAKAELMIARFLK